MKCFAAMCAMAAALVAVGCKPADTTDADLKAVQATENQWNQDFVSKDVDKLAAHYADDAVLMIPGMPAVTGKEAIHTALKQMETDPAMLLAFHASKMDVSKSGDLAYTRGTYTLKMTDPESKQVVSEQGSYVTTYRKQADGTWKAVVDISTSEPPLPLPPAPAPKQ